MSLFNFHCSAFFNLALAFFFIYTTQTLVSAATPPIEHATTPSVLWNANIQSPPGK